MTKKELLDGFAAGGTLHFEMNGKKCGVETTVMDSKWMYQSWCGESIREYSDRDEMLHDPFFDQKALKDLINVQELQFA